MPESKFGPKRPTTRTPPRNTTSTGMYYGTGYDYYDRIRDPAKEKRRLEEKRRQTRYKIYGGLAVALGLILVGGLISRDRNKPDPNQEALRALASPTATLVLGENSPTQQTTEWAPTTIAIEEASATPTELPATSTPSPTVELPTASPTTEPTLPPTATATFEPTSTPTNTATATELPSSPTPEATARPKELRSSFGVVSVDANEIPIGYTLLDGTSVTFTEAERAEFNQIREQAMNNQEPEIVLRIPVSDRNEAEREFAGSPEHPLVTELPADVLTEAELRAYGIVDIIQAPNTTLSIRRSAFEPGGILENLPAAQQLEHPPQLRIVLIDGAAAVGNFMTDPRYDGVRDMIPMVTGFEVSNYRAEKISEAEASLEALRQDAIARNEPIDEGFALVYKGRIQDWKDIPDAEIIKKIVDTQSSTAGYYAPARLREANGAIIDTVFVTVGQGVQTAPDTIEGYYNSEGQLIVGDQLEFGNGRDTRPNASNAFLNPSDLTRNDQASRELDEYPYGAQEKAPGLTLRHELYHFILMRLNPKLFGDTANPSEYDTDEAAVAQLMEEYDAWAKDKDVNGPSYPFVFTIPAELTPNGVREAYMLTENRSIIPIDLNITI